MNREIKFEIKLKAKEPINGYKAGETVIIVNPIFDPGIGIAFWPIDKNFEIVYKRQFTGLKDRGGFGKDVYDGDIIGRTSFLDKIIVWNKCGFYTKHAYSDTLFPLTYLDEFDVVIGNIHENPELLNQ